MEFTYKIYLTSFSEFYRKICLFVDIFNKKGIFIGMMMDQHKLNFHKWNLACKTKSLALIGI